MKHYFKDLYNYHHATNQAIVKLLMDYQHLVTERSLGLISHSINAHQIWNARINGTQPFGVFETHSVENISKFDTANYHSTIEIIDSTNLEKVIEYNNSKGEPYSNAVADILFHISNHHSHHRGQLISDLKSSGIPSIVTDYIFYKRKPIAL